MSYPATTYLAAPNALDTPIIEVLKAWQQADPSIYPLRFGGQWWHIDRPEDRSKSLNCEFAVATDALASRGWPFELVSKPGDPALALVEFAPGRVATATDEDPYAALIRATVYATSIQLYGDAPSAPLVLAVSASGLPLTEAEDPQPTTTPAEDVRVWSRIEPHRFDKGAAHFTSPLYRGGGQNVLAPAFRAVAALQYWTTGCVYESAAEHGWTMRLKGSGVGGSRSHLATVELPDGPNATGSFVTPGPACVKAYLTALHLNSGGSISILPRPTDKYWHRVVVAHTDKYLLHAVYDHATRQDRYIPVTGTFAIEDANLRQGVKGVPDDLEILDRVPTDEEVAASRALGILA